MLVIRSEQLRVFEQAGRRQFQDEMVAHSRRFTPRLAAVLGDDQLRVAVRSAIGRAEAYGFTNRGPVRLFVEMMFLCGSGFDTDPQYPQAGEALRADDDQMARAERIHEWHNEYLDRVSGPGAANVRRALRDLRALVDAPLTIGADDIPGGLLREMGRIFPQKATYVGEPALRTLIDAGASEARNRGFAGVRPTALLVVLKFAFGHRCTDDPLYPWIAQTLTDERIVSPEARAARLEKKAATWLEHVVASNETGTTP